MKKLNVFVIVSILILTCGNSYAQIAADYYLPLNVGATLNFHCDNGPQTSDYYAARTTKYEIEGIDSISGEVYFREKGTEVIDGIGVQNVFNIFWLKLDPTGNVVLGAIANSESASIDSAIIFDWIIFPNEYLIEGYTREYEIEGDIIQDSVISIKETVSVPAGIFNNCLEILTTHFDNDGISNFREIKYYAKNIGLVKNIRVIPERDAHTDELISYIPTEIMDNNEIIPTGYLLSQNYPNPFNPSTKIKFSLPKESKVTLIIYNALGQEVSRLVNQQLTAGSHDVDFNKSNYSGGIYFYKLQAGVFIDTKKMILLK